MILVALLLTSHFPLMESPVKNVQEHKYLEDSQPPPPLMHPMNSRERRHLIQSARKLSKLLGETPILSTALDAGNIGNSSDVIESGKEEIFPPSISLRRKPSKLDKILLKGKMGRVEASASTIQTDMGILTAHDVPRQCTPSQGSQIVSSNSSSCIKRSPPVLKLDCTRASGGRGKRPRQSSSLEDSDAKSFISTTTVATIQTISTLVASPLSPKSAISALALEKAKLKEARRTKMAKLKWYLGETVPTELVFPAFLNTPTSEITNGEHPQFATIQSRLTKVAKDTPVRARRGNTVPLLRKPSPAGTRDRRSLQLDPAHLKPIRNMSQSEGNTPVSTPVSTTAGLNISHAFPFNATGSTLLPLCSSTESSPSDSSVVDYGRARAKCGSKNFVKLRSPMGSKRKAISIRRAQKITRVFGAPPPNSVLQLSMQNQDKETDIPSSLFSSNSRPGTPVSMYTCKFDEK